MEGATGLFLPLADFTTINYDIVLLGTAVDLNGAEREFVEMHMRTPCTLISCALFGCDSGERGPALLDVLAATMRTLNFASLVFDEGKNLVEEFLAIVAQKFVVRHAGPRS
jgi:hypothetical protein